MKLWPVAPFFTHLWHQGTYKTLYCFKEMTCCNVLYVPRFQKWVKKKGATAQSFIWKEITTYRIGTLVTIVVCIYLVYVENGYAGWVSRINNFIITIIWFNLKAAVASSLNWINAKLIPIFIFTYCPDFSIFRLNKPKE